MSEPVQTQDAGQVPDPATTGAMGDQSAGGAYARPSAAKPATAHAKGGQSDPAYSGPGQLAGRTVDPAADANAVTHEAD